MVGLFILLIVSCIIVSVLLHYFIKESKRDKQYHERIQEEINTNLERYEDQMELGNTQAANRILNSIKNEYPDFNKEQK